MDEVAHASRLSLDSREELGRHACEALEVGIAKVLSDRDAPWRVRAAKELGAGFADLHQLGVLDVALAHRVEVVDLIFAQHGDQEVDA